MSGEEWRDVAGYEGLYQVSSFGRIRSLARKKVLPVHNTSNGYFQVHLYREGKAKYAYVHRLVADAFCVHGNQLQNEVNHIDGDRINNRADNLEWCTRSENHRTEIYIRRQIEAKRRICKPVLQLTLEGEYIATFHGLHEASRQTGAPRHCIKKCCDGIARHAGGYRWQFAQLAQ